MSLTPEQILSGSSNDQIGTQLVKDTESMRIWHLRLAPGQTIPPHRHDRPYFWTVVSDGKGLSCFDDGRDLEVIYKAGDTKHFPNLTPETGFVHDLTNIGDTELVFVTVEFTS
jgi:quercetin dioxygenase-like cupin family protein